ncbi:putative retroelement protein [Coprinopsis sp. MPI-PUGE-AT-0042]|nr:putative retroelement protein [Coprinopsis sp. MPI-PUGE-AT-0042]
MPCLNNSLLERLEQLPADPPVPLLKRIRSTSVPPDLEFPWLDKGSDKRLSKRLRVSSQDFVRGRSPKPTPLGSFSPRSMSMEKEQTMTLEQRLTSPIAATSKRSRNSRRRQPKGGRGWAKQEAAEQMVTTPAPKPCLLSRLTSPRWNASVCDDEERMTMMDPRDLTLVDPSVHDSTAISYPGVNGMKSSPLQPQIPTEQKLDASSSSSPPIPLTLSKTSASVRQRQISLLPNGTASSEGTLSTLTRSSPPSTMSILLKRTLGAWETARLPLERLGQPRPSKPKLTGMPRGLPLAQRMTTPLRTAAPSWKSTEGTSFSSSQPRFLPQREGSSSTIEPSDISLEEDNDIHSPTEKRIPTFAKPSSPSMVSKPMGLEGPEVEVVEKGSGLEPATSSTVRVDVVPTMDRAGTGMSVRAVGETTMVSRHVKEEEAKRRDYVQRYMRYNDWGSSSPLRAPEWTIKAKPLPSPPTLILQDPILNRTIFENPHLFRISTPVDIEKLEEFTMSHPNPKFVASVLNSFRDGFWPLVPGYPESYPTTLDESNDMPRNPDHAEFLKAQRDVELERGRYSEGFPSLLEGMYSMPLHVVPKDGGDGLRLVTNHSKGPYSLNSMVNKSSMPKVPLDNMRSLGDDILDIRRRHPNEELTLWKSDVAEAYRLIPMHPFWQIKQAERIDGEFHINWCNVFGGRASQFLFIAFMALVSWVATNIVNIPYLSEYSDDHFGIARASDILWYEPYKRDLPSAQAKLLMLWDALRIPHKQKKQTSGNPLVIIGISVDVARFTFTLPEKARADLLAELDRWIDPEGDVARYGLALQYWQQMAGWLNWSFNVYPLLRPCLSNSYAKCKGKQPGIAFRPNNAIRSEFRWAANHIRKSDGVHLLDSLHWDPTSDADHVIYCDACMKGMGFWVKNEDLGFYSPTINMPVGEDFIFVHEAMCVLSAICWLDEHEAIPQRVTIYTDNSNTADVFNSLSASPRINPILMAACDIALTSIIDFKVLFVPGVRNPVADALSRFDITRAIDEARADPSAPSHLRVSPFKPPSIKLGAAV